MGWKRKDKKQDAKGFLRKEGIKHTKIFSHVVNQTFVSVVLSMVTQMDMHLQQLDVTTAFLHGELEEEVYRK